MTASSRSGSPCARLPQRTPPSSNWRSVSAMSNLRRLIAWLLLALVAVVGAGAAVLGVAQAPDNVPLSQAVNNTLGAANYSEVVAESTPQGNQTDYLVYQAPDKLGGYIQSGNKRTYVYVIGTKEYQSLTVTPNTPTENLVFYEQPSQGAAALDPAHNYLGYAQQRQARPAVGVHLHVHPDPGRTGRDLRLHRVREVRVGDRPLTVQDGVGPADHLAGRNITAGGAARRSQGGRRSEQPDRPWPASGTATGRPAAGRHPAGSVAGSLAWSMAESMAERSRRAAGPRGRSPR